MTTTPRTFTLSIVISAATLGLVSPAAAQLDVLALVRAPIAPDGTTAGAPTDFVITLVDRDPSVDGIGLEVGGTIEVVLPDSFTITPSLTNTAVPLQGWPQSPPGPPPAGNWTTTINAATNTIRIVMNVPFLPGGAFGPALKQVHLILLQSESPRPGRYPIEITVDPDGPAGPARPESGVGHVRIIPRARPSINTISLFSGGGPPPPFNNPIYQTVARGDDPNQVGFYLWNTDAAPYLGVDLVMTNPAHGRLVNVATGKTVGHVWVEAPVGAEGFELTTTGPSTLGVAFVTGVPTGLLLTQFSPDPTVIGDYRIRLRMNNGNTETLFVSVGP